MNFYQDVYQERTIVRRVFLSENISKEALVLFTGLLNEFPEVHLKAGLSSLAGADFSFSCYHYSNGYVLEGKITQTNSDTFSYLFSNPYKQGENALLQAFEKGYVYSEKNLAIVKEKLALDNEVLLRSSSRVIEDCYHALYANVIIDMKKLQQVKKEDLDNLLKEIQKLDHGDYIYFGKKDKTELYFPISYKGGLPKLEKKNTSSHSIDTTSSDDETVFYILDVPQSQTSVDYYHLQASFALIKKSIEEELDKKLSIDYQVEFVIVDDKTYLLEIITEKGKGKNILDVLKVIDEKFFFPINIDESLAKMEIQLLHLQEKMDSSLYLRNRILFSDLNVEEKEFAFSLDKVKEVLSNIRIKNFNIEGEEHD